MLLGLRFFVLFITYNLFIVLFTRSDLPTNPNVGYTYTITFSGMELGGRIVEMNSVNTFTSTASDGNGELCQPKYGCPPDSKFVRKDVKVTSIVKGASIKGTFQLTFKGDTTSPLSYDVEEQTVEDALNSLPSISPSRVKVTRTSSPIYTPLRQVGGYVWSITFNSNKWKDPTESHSVYTDGNWVGQNTTWADEWPSGFSKAWGKNVGDQAAIQCLSSSTLYSTNDPNNKARVECNVEEVVKGTSPLAGSFILSLNTTGHPIINIQQNIQSLPIKHNAKATALESGGDGTSMQEILESMSNIGKVNVTRSAVKPKTGGYTWFITFLRDKDDIINQAGQFNGKCQQKDSFYGLCNSPGNVPKLSYSESTLQGSCLNISSFSCTKITIMDQDDRIINVEPPGIKEIQSLYIDHTDFSPGFVSGFLTDTFFEIYFENTPTNKSSCLRSNISDSDLESNIKNLLPASTKGVLVTSDKTNTVQAKGGRIFRIKYFDEDDIPQLKININETACPPLVNYRWNVTQETITHGSKYGMTATDAKVVHGVVQRGDFTVFKVSGDSQITNINLPWNVLPEPTLATNVSVKTHLESSGINVVNVTRKVIGQFGEVEYEIIFVNNQGQTPPGAGDVNILIVEQNNATDNILYPPLVQELTKGSRGISGSFNIDLHSPDGPRLVSFEESPTRLKRKLEEFLTVGKIYVSRSEYPSSRSGGWGSVKVPRNSLGGSIKYLKKNIFIFLCNKLFN